MRHILLLVSVLCLGLTSACSNKASLFLGTVGDTMAFDHTEFKVKAGAEVTLTLKNNGTSAAMQHNFILTKPGKEMEVSTASMAAGPDKGYVADHPDILAHTKLLKPGESDTITFKAPTTPGTYPFLCSFPGHFPLMKGLLIVQ